MFFVHMMRCFCPRQDAQSSRSQMLSLHEQHIDSSEWWHLNPVGWIQSHEHLIFDIESKYHPKVCRTILILSFSLVSRSFVSPKFWNLSFLYIALSFWDFIMTWLFKIFWSSCFFHLRSNLVLPSSPRFIMPLRDFAYPGFATKLVTKYI